MKKYLVFGAGNLACKNYRLLKKLFIANEIEILAFIDNDQRKWGSTLEQIPIISPKRINEFNYDGISIWSNYKEEILKQLKDELRIPTYKINNLMSLYLEAVYNKYGQCPDQEIKDFLEIMKKKNEVSAFYFQEKKEWTPYEAFYDADKDLHYIIFEEKKVYIKRNSELQLIGDKKFFRDIWYEQDENSPHLYEEGDICVEQGDVIVDVGACEGNFTIHNIDKIKKGYIIECDPGWLEALRYTFEPYKDKIDIIEAYVGSKDTKKTRRLDTLCNESVNFIKMDIEGAEIEALNGAIELLNKSKNLKCAICAYHRHNDEIKIKDILNKNNFITSVSRGYMLFIYDQEVRDNPELRRGIVRGKNRT